MFADHPLVVVVGATGLQGGAVVKALLEKGKYKIRCLTRDVTSDKAQKIRALNTDMIQLVRCDILSKSDLLMAFKDSWAVFAVTDFMSYPNDEQADFTQGKLMADTAMELNVKYFIFSTATDTDRFSNGKFRVPHMINKAKVQQYLTSACPELKSIFIHAGFYYQNWLSGLFPVRKIDENGTMEFALPLISINSKLYQEDINDIGPLVAQILEQPDSYIGRELMCIGEVCEFGDVPKLFTKVTGIPAVARTLSETEMRDYWNTNNLPTKIQNDLLMMFKFIQFVSDHNIENPFWNNAHGLMKFNTFEAWLKKIRWRGLQSTL